MNISNSEHLNPNAKFFFFFISLFVISLFYVVVVVDFVASELNRKLVSF